MPNVIGRIPPHSTESEIAVLGAVLFRNKALENVQSLLVKEDFYTKSHQKIWEGIVVMHDEEPGVTIDIQTLPEFLKQKGTLEECGGYSYIANLTNSIPASSGILYHAQIVKNCSLKRRLLELSVVMGDKAFDPTEDVKSSIDYVDEKLSALALNMSTDNFKSSGHFLYQFWGSIQDKLAGKKKNGISTGFKKLDYKLDGGFKQSDLVIIGARPSVGKTALALSLAHNMAFNVSNPIKVGFFSLEMSGETLMERVVAREASINSRILRNGLLDLATQEQLRDCVDRMYDYSDNLLIQETPNIKLMEIKTQSRRMVRDDGVKIIFIDYIGLIETESSSMKPRHEQIGEISRSLKSLARELNVPVVVLSQVNRDAGKDRPPILADLRESGSIEQDADVVILLDDESKRLDDNNKISQYAEDGSEIENQDPNAGNRPIKIIIAKQRNGSTGAFNMMFQSNYVSFTEIDKSF